MNTYKVTKKQIQEILKSENRTEIFKLVKKVVGNCNQSTVFKFIQSNAKTQKMHNSAYHIAYCGRLKYAEFEVEKCITFVGKMRHYADEYRINPNSSYAKTLIKGNTHAYWASPIYGHSDYNKSRAFKLLGNERLFEILCKYMSK